MAYCRQGDARPASSLASLSRFSLGVPFQSTPLRGWNVERWTAGWPVPPGTDGGTTAWNDGKGRYFLAKRAEGRCRTGPAWNDHVAPGKRSSTVMSSCSITLAACSTASRSYVHLFLIFSSSFKKSINASSVGAHCPPLSPSSSSSSSKGSLPCEGYEGDTFPGLEKCPLRQDG